MTTFSFEPIAYPTPEELDARKAAAPTGDRPADPDLPDLTVAAPLPRPSVPSPEVEAQARARALEEIRSAAHQQGFDEGRRAEAERLRTLEEALNSTIAELHREDERREREAVERVAALATAIAGHLIEREIRTGSDVLADMVRRAINEFPVNEVLTVHLNPSDLAQLTSGLTDDGAGHLTGGQTVEWVADPSLKRGGVLVGGAERIVDARLSRIMERIYGALTDG